AIVDERIAAALWNGHAIGKSLRVGSRRTLETVGVTTAVRTTSLKDDGVPSVFVPFHVAPRDLTLVIKTAPRANVTSAIREVVASLGTGRTAYDIQPLADYVATATSASRLVTSVLLIFGAAALGLAAIGLFGTFAYLVSTRTQEFGVRFALGATPRDLIRLVT